MSEDKKVYNISVLDIIPNRFQPRLNFNEEELLDLAASIRQHGIIEPLILRKIGEKFEIIAGERRYKAACIVGLTTVPAVIVEADDKKSAELAVVENVQRKNLTSLEEAQSYKKLANNGYTQEEIARKIGVSQATIANKIRLLNLCPEVQNALLSGKISERHARSILALQNPVDQINILNRITTERLTVKQTDEEINKIVGRPENMIDTENLTQNATEVIPLDRNVPSIEELLKIDDKIEPIVEEKNVVPSFINTINPFVEPEEDKMETLDFEVNTPAPIEIIEDDGENKVDSALEETRNIINKLKEQGINISSEEFDFNNMYQIVIKIQKE